MTGSHLDGGGGDIREVLRTMFASPEFWSPASYRAKVYDPEEFVIPLALSADETWSVPPHCWPRWMS